MQGNRGFARLEKRILTLEGQLLALGSRCSCRSQGQTTFHNAEELRMIMDVRCQAHLFRDLGELSWLPSGLPLQSEDRRFCCCPQSQIREFILGRRQPLTERELREDQDRWEREYGPGAVEAWRRERANLSLLLQQYQDAKRKHGGAH